MFLAIAGPIGSGKSTLARLLAARLPATLVSFGDYVRHLREIEGIQSSRRKDLQDLGQQLVGSDPTGFVRNALAWAVPSQNISVIFDGVRHEAVWREIKTEADRAGQGSKLIFINVEDSERLRRLQARGLSPADIREFDSHPSELDVLGRLKLRADVLLDGTETIARVAENAMSALNSGSSKSFG